MTNALTIIILAPLAGSVLLALVGRRLGERAIGLVASAAILVSASASFYVFFQQLLPLREDNRVIHEYLFTWIKVGAFRSDAALLLDPLSGVYILFITFVGFLIHVFATGYMRGEKGYWRFFTYLNLFMFMMLLLVLADNFLLMFVGWEGVGLCSYLLIGFYYEKTFAGDAAKKAFIVNRIGDFGFALGLMLLFWKAGTIFYFTDPVRGIQGAFNWAMTQPAESLALSAVFAGGMTTVAALLFVGAIGKSAQIPLFVWLPDAMAGPTPVSALIHAATMVTAGVYMVSRASSIFIHAPAAMLIIAVVGAATALFAATIGLAQWDIKKVLAYSTISQLGYMFLACGVGAFTAGIFHVFTHAFFKALLFLGSGSVIIALHHEQDMRRMGGLKKYLPITFWTMVCGWLAISGLPLLSGFFSKDEILFSAYASTQFGETTARVLWAAGAITAFLTAVYMTRMMTLTFFGDRRAGGSSHGHAAEAHAVPHESPWSMTAPLVILAIGAVVVGYFGVPEGLSGGKIPNYFEHLLRPSIASEAHTSAKAGDEAAVSHSLEWILTLISSAIAIIGILTGLRWFKRKPLWEPPKLLEEKYRVDEAYDATVVRPIKSLSTGLLWKLVDVRVIDGAVNGVAKLAEAAGAALRHLQGGLARAYVAMVVLGALLIIGYFVTK